MMLLLSFGVVNVTNSEDSRTNFEPTMNNTNGKERTGKNTLSKIWIFINTPFISNLLSNSIFSVISFILSWFIYSASSNSEHIDYSHANLSYALVILIVSPFILVTINTLISKISEYFISLVNVKNIISCIILIVFILVTLHSLFPPFEITEPKDNSFVSSKITVSGHGAMPESDVSVYVIYNGAPYPQQSIQSTTNGVWRLSDVKIGKEHDEGKEFTIYATCTKDGVNCTTLPISVTRSKL